MPTDLESLKQLGPYNQPAAYFMTAGEAAFGFMLPILAGFIGFSIAEKPGLVAGFVAGAIADSGAAPEMLHTELLKQLFLPHKVPVSFGALVGGFLAGGVILVLRKVLAGLPRTLDGIRSILLLPLLGVGFHRSNYVCIEHPNVSY